MAAQTCEEEHSSLVHRARVAERLAAPERFWSAAYIPGGGGVVGWVEFQPARSPSDGAASLLRVTAPASPAPASLLRVTAPASPAPASLLRVTAPASPAPASLLRVTAPASPATGRNISPSEQAFRQSRRVDQIAITPHCAWLPANCAGTSDNPRYTSIASMSQGGNTFTPAIGLR